MSFDEKMAYLQAYFEYLDRVGRTSGVLRKMKADFIRAVETTNEKLLNLVFKEAQKRIRDTFSIHEEALLRRQCQHLELVSDVLKKGRIECSEEYELLLDRVENLINESNESDELKQCNKLLADYDRIKKRNNWDPH